ncbi:MAG: TIGR00266 family protein [Selenomonadaceae bacterium]|nr:TIGR00266 family protein [Selenomonadaceae bacterium]
MKYQILYPEAFPVVEYNLERGERLKAESDAMIAMSPTIDVTGKMEGGIVSGLMRKVLAGESFFFQELVATRGPGKVLFGHALPGGILDVELDGSYNLMVQKDGFLAGTQGINVDTKMQNLAKGFLSGEGFFILKISGRGTVFVSSFGVIHPINLESGEEVIIDNGHLVAWPDYMDYNIEKASQGWLNSLTSGEGLVCRFRGPGTVLIQTRNPGGFEGWLRSLLPTGGGSDSSAGSALSSLFNR